MRKKFEFNPSAIVSEAIGNVPYPGTLTPVVVVLCAIAERLEAIYEEMVEAKKDRRA